MINPNDYAKQVDQVENIYKENYRLHTERDLQFEKIEELEHEVERLKAKHTWLVGKPDKDDCYIGWSERLGVIPVWFENGKFYLYGLGGTEQKIDKYMPLPEE